MNMSAAVSRNVFREKYNGTVTAGNSVGPFAADDCLLYPTWGFRVLSTKRGRLTVEYSPDGTNWDTLDTVRVRGNIPRNLVYRVTLRYYRVSFTNTSSSDATVKIDTVRSTV